MSRFVSRWFVDDEIEALLVSYRVFRVLLYYVDPGLASKLDEADFVPELYATAWLITLFSRSVCLSVCRGVQLAVRGGLCVTLRRWWWVVRGLCGMCCVVAHVATCLSVAVLFVCWSCRCGAAILIETFTTARTVFLGGGDAALGNFCPRVRFYRGGRPGIEAGYFCGARRKRPVPEVPCLLIPTL